MKSVMAVENGNERRKGLRVCLFMLVLGLCLCAGLLAGCTTQQPGETAREVHRRHHRTYRLNSQMMMSDIDKFLLLDKPSMLTDKRIP
jgi:hypothetical protein